MDTKSEKLALFKYALIAPLVIEPLPRGELTRRAQEIAGRHYDIPDSKRTGFPLTHCWTGRCAIATAALKPWRHRPGRIAGNSAASRRNSPI